MINPVFTIRILRNPSIYRTEKVKLHLEVDSESRELSPENGQNPGGICWNFEEIVEKVKGVL